MEHTLSAGDRVVDPRLGADLRPNAGSPAVDRSGATSYTRDGSGAVLPVDGNRDGVAEPDLGALELQG